MKTRTRTYPLAGSFWGKLDIFLDVGVIDLTVYPFAANEDAARENARTFSGGIQVRKTVDIPNSHTHEYVFRPATIDIIGGCDFTPEQAERFSQALHEAVKQAALLDEQYAKIEFEEGNDDDR